MKKMMILMMLLLMSFKVKGSMISNKADFMHGCTAGVLKALFSNSPRPPYPQELQAIYQHCYRIMMQHNNRDLPKRKKIRKQETDL